MKRATHTMMGKEFWWGQMRRGPTGFPLGKAGEIQIAKRPACGKRAVSLLLGKRARFRPWVAASQPRPRSSDRLSSLDTSNGTLRRGNFAWNAANACEKTVTALGSVNNCGRMGGQLDRQGTAAKEPCAEACHGLASPCGDPPRASEPAAARRRA
jgi:hypothetical protein